MAAAIDLPMMMMPTTASTCSGCSTSTLGSNSMPTETKNSTANASRSGKDSSAARWLNSDSRMTMPAKKAPSANDTPNNLDAANAMLTAAAITHSVNNSRVPVRATIHKILGNTRRPITSMSATKPPTCKAVAPRMRHKDCGSGAPAPWAVWPPSQLASGGSNTSTSTMARSSTTNQPTAMRPFIDSRVPCASSARNSTTVLATDKARPNTSAPPTPQPHQYARPKPSAVATAICSTAPGTAMRRTASRSSSEKCRPTPNINSMTPISASSPAMATSATKPGVNGPMRMPASR